MKRKHRDILNRTGTTHLLIVLGLHVGLIASIYSASLPTHDRSSLRRVSGSIGHIGIWVLASLWGFMRTTAGAVGSSRCRKGPG